MNGITREQVEGLGRRALAAGWPAVPMPGELRRSSKDFHGHPAVVRIKWGDEKPAHRFWPDFRDAATAGILLVGPVVVDVKDELINRLPG